MPYCPKCDMEFIDGITVCSDCGGPLAESEEAALAMKEQEIKERLEKEMAQMNEMARMNEIPEGWVSSEDVLPDDAAVEQTPIAPAKIYVDKKQKYDDLKSSASAFLIVGTVLLAASIVCWTGIVNIPMAGVSKIIFQSALVIMGLLSFFVAIGSSKSAKALAPQIEEEKQATRDLIQWFIDTYTGEEIDRSVSDADKLTPEELSLKRFSVIQDFLITSHDLPDQAYVDALSEDIYSRLYD